MGASPIIDEPFLNAAIGSAIFKVRFVPHIFTLICPVNSSAQKKQPLVHLPDYPLAPRAPSNIKDKVGSLTDN